MNHSIAFHTLRRQLCGEVATLQRKGYYGDGEPPIIPFQSHPGILT